MQKTTNFKKISNFFKKPLTIQKGAVSLQHQKQNMELIQTDIKTAYNILESNTRVIRATKGSINLNNETFMMQWRKKDNQLMQNCEDYIFYIQVPKNAKTVF